MKTNNNKVIMEPFLSPSNTSDLINEYVRFDHLERGFDIFFKQWVDHKLKPQATPEESIYVETIINNIKFVLFKSPTLKDTQIIIKSWNTTINTIKTMIKHLSNVETFKEIIKFNSFIRLMEIFLSFNDFISSFTFQTKLIWMSLWFKVIVESLVTTITYNNMFLEQTLNSKNIFNYWNFETKNEIIKFIKNN